MSKFHRLCGKNVSLDYNCTTATQMNTTKDGGYYGIVMTNKPLKKDKMFEIQVNTLHEDDGLGSLSLGVATSIPENLKTIIESTAFLKGGLMLSGYALHKNQKPSKGYSLNLNEIKVGDKLGMMRAADNTLHFYLNGNDKGIAFSDLPPVIYGVVDLYGLCCEVFITHTDYSKDTGAQVAIDKASNFRGRPADWDVNTVCEFIESIPDCAPYADKLRSEHINGAALVELDKKDMKEFFGMPLGLAVNVCSHLKKLKKKNK